MSRCSASHTKNLNTFSQFTILCFNLLLTVLVKLSKNSFHNRYWHYHIITIPSNTTSSCHNPIQSASLEDSVYLINIYEVEIQEERSSINNKLKTFEIKPACLSVHRWTVVGQIKHIVPILSITWELSVTLPFIICGQPVSEKFSLPRMSET